MSEILESNRFISAQGLVRDLCVREKDFILSNRLYYMSLVKDAYIKLNFKTQMFTKRVALQVVRGTVPYILTPKDYLDLSSISAENECGLLEPMIINTKIKTGIADLSLVKRCGCGCGCEGELCASVRSFEDITGTMDAVMPGGGTQTFNTLYRKIILKDGTYVEQKTLPTLVYTNNIHTATILETQERTICNLELKECGCVKDNDHNRNFIERDCSAVNYRFECGCAVEDLNHFRQHDRFAHHHNDRHESYNIDEEGDRIYLPSNFRPDFVVMRFYANSKTKDILIPFLAKEPMMSAIKVIDTTFDKKAPANLKQFWKSDFKQKEDELKENLSPINMTSFYDRIFPGTPNHHR